MLSKGIAVINKKILVSCLALIGAVNLLRADWSDYKEINLSEAWAAAVVQPGSTSDSFVGAPQNYKFLVKATYTGKLRKIDTKRAEFMAKWGKVMGTEEFTARYADEIEVRAGGQIVWLPIQQGLMTPFRKEVKTGTPLQLWIMYIGAVREDRVFLINDFEAGPELAFRGFAAEHSFGHRAL